MTVIALVYAPLALAAWNVERCLMARAMRNGEGGL